MVISISTNINLHIFFIGSIHIIDRGYIHYQVVPSIYNIHPKRLSPNCSPKKSCKKLCRYHLILRICIMVDHTIACCGLGFHSVACMLLCQSFLCAYGWPLLSSDFAFCTECSSIRWHDSKVYSYRWLTDYLASCAPYSPTSSTRNAEKSWFSRGSIHLKGQVWGNLFEGKGPSTIDIRFHSNLRPQKILTGWWTKREGVNNLLFHVQENKID